MSLKNERMFILVKMTEQTQQKGMNAQMRLTLDTFICNLILSSLNTVVWFSFFV